MMEVLEEMRLNKKQIDRIVVNLAQLIERVEKAEDELREHRAPLRRPDEASCARCCARRATNPADAKKLQRRLNITPEQLEALDRDVRTAVRKIKKVEEEANLPIDELRRNYEAIRIGERQGRARQEPSWSRPTCASWCRSPRSTRTAACSSWT